MFTSINQIPAAADGFVHYAVDTPVVTASETVYADKGDHVVGYKRRTAISLTTYEQGACPACAENEPLVG